jgi:hypothetical protein
MGPPDGQSSLAASLPSASSGPAGALQLSPSFRYAAIPDHPASLRTSKARQLLSQVARSLTDSARTGTAAGSKCEHVRHGSGLDSVIEGETDAESNAAAGKQDSGSRGTGGKAPSSSDGLIFNVSSSTLDDSVLSSNVDSSASPVAVSGVAHMHVSGSFSDALALLLQARQSPAPSAQPSQTSCDGALPLPLLCHVSQEATCAQVDAAAGPSLSPFPAEPQLLAGKPKASLPPGASTSAAQAPVASPGCMPQAPRAGADSSRDESCLHKLPSALLAECASTLISCACVRNVYLSDLTR